jgi:uncharacterized damage-inducible protein DinB
MNARDILFYGNRTVLNTLAAVPAAERETPNVCGWWSTRHIVAHLASFEWLLVDALLPFAGGESTGTLARMGDLGGQGFNDYEVAQRKEKTYEDILAEYKAAHARTLEQVEQIPAETLREAGRIPWYGSGYALDDLIVYQYYGHKREHMAQIGVFLDTLA